MSRKDTIIIAALINSALLAVLFLMAVQTINIDTSPSGQVAQEELIPNFDEKPVQLEPSVIAYTHVATRDEIDKVLKDYSLNDNEPVVIHEDRPEATETKALLEKEETKYVEVTIKRGDYLERIARDFGTTVSAIMRENNLPTPRIDVGQVLKIPVNDKGVRAAPTVTTQSQYYTMKVGDNPWKIAKQFQVRFDELLKLNDLDEARARSLKPGDKIRVR